MMDRRDEAGRVLALAGTLLSFLLLATGCGNLTAGGIGEASVVLSGDAPEVVPQSSVVATPPDLVAGSGPLSIEGPLAVDEDDDDPEGEFEADLAVFLVAADGDLVPLTNGLVRVRVDLQGVDEPEIGSRVVSATSYTHLRMIFEEIEVEVDAGLVVNGDTIIGPVDIELDNLALTVEKPLAVDVADGERVEVLVDLNSDSWLQAIDPEALTVDAQTFADLVGVRLR